MTKGLFSKSSKLANMTRYLRRNFNLWGYEEVFLPAIEDYSDELDKGTKYAYKDEFYVIKPDLTSQILKNLEEPEEKKLFYISEVLDGDTQGDWQCGVEFIGGKDLWMQVEVLMMVLTSLDSLGIEDFYVDIGSLEVWERTLDGINEYRDEIFKALHRRNFEIIDDLPIDESKKDDIWDLFNFRGKETDYEKLDRIIKALDDDRVFLDFGTIRPLPYYDDLIFEIYSPKLGYPIGAGGEYEFQDENCFGFAFDLEALLELYEPKKGSKRKIIDENLSKSYQKAREMIEMGIPVEVSK